jgi:hypothetical protein
LALIAALAANPNQPAEEKAPGSRNAHPVRRQHIPDEGALSLVQESDATARWTFGVGGGVGFESSIAPSPGYGLSIAFDAEGYPGSAFRPLLSLLAIRVFPSATATPGGDASLDWVTFRLAACPVRWPEETPLFIRPCGFLDAGLLGADVQHHDSGQSLAQTKPWAAIGGFLRTEALVAEVLSFQLDGGLTLPLIRSSFSAGDDLPVAFQVPATGVLGRIGLSYRFR